MSHKWSLPKHDINAPDLYIPLMSFMTYILLFGLYKALVNDRLAPDLLIEAVWRCLLIQGIEVGLIKVALTTIGASLPFLDLFAYTGYKYVGLCISTIPGIFLYSLFQRTYTLTIVFSLYTSLMLGFFVIKAMAAAVPQTLSAGTGPPRHLVLLACAALELVVSLLLNWY